MSYGRNPHYIINDGDNIEIVTSGIKIPNNILNALLYKMLLKNRRDELAQRLQEGKKEWLNAAPEDNYEHHGFLRFIKINEDDTIRQLMMEGN